MSFGKRCLVSGSVVALVTILGLSQGAIAQPSAANKQETTLDTEALREVPATVDQVFDSGLVRVSLEDGSVGTIPLTESDVDRLDLERGDRVMLLLDDSDRVVALTKDNDVATLNLAERDTDADVADTDIERDSVSGSRDEETIIESRTTTTTTPREPIAQDEPTTAQQSEPIRGLW